jgi:microcystin degradation protein MlrC
MRVCLAGIYHESNTFLTAPTTLQNLLDGHLFVGDQIRNEYSSAFHEIGGILEVFDYSDIEIVPLFFADAIPGGTIDKETYEYLRAEMLKTIQMGGAWDGIMLCAHGAAVSEGYLDTDGNWFKRIREQVGDQIPIVATIDPHANVSADMADSVNAIVSYSTNPHLDQRETGKKAARLLLDEMYGKVQLELAFIPTQVSISIEQQDTFSEPCIQLYEMASEMLSKDQRILSISIILGFPYSDVPKMGSSFIVVTDGKKALARETGIQLKQYLEENRKLFVGKSLNQKEAVSCALNMMKPVLLLDMGDNVGGGSPGDSTFLLREMEEYGTIKYLLSIYDPDAVAQCENAGVGSKLFIAIGAKTDNEHGTPYQLNITVKILENGYFQEKERRHGGQVKYDMGRIAILETANGSTIQLMSKRVPPFSLSQLTTFGIKPKNFDMVVAKGVNAPIAAYGSVCTSIIKVNTPGVTCADATQFIYNNRKKPLFPFEDF